MANEKRLIYANEVIKETESILNFRRQHHMPTAEYEALLGYLKKRPTVDAVEVVHGRWTPNFEYDFDRGEHRLTGYHCNQCGIWTLKKSNYCPNCGADMRGETE